MKYFKNYIIGRERTIKDLLMDQKFLSGLGNIYVNEILFFSGVIPTKKIKQLSDFDIKKIIKFSKKIISKAIVLGGSSIKDFSSSSGKKGLFQQYFTVYGKKGENCSKVKCMGKIKKIVIAKRASFFLINAKNNKVGLYLNAHIYNRKKCQILNQQSEELEGLKNKPK